MISNEFIKYSYPLFFSTIFSSIILQFFNFLLPIYASPDLIGNLSAANNFTTILTFFLVPINIVLFPLFSKLDDKKFLNNIYQKSTKYLTLIIFPISVAFISLSDQIIVILYGSSYSSSSIYLKIIMIDYIIIALGTYQIHYLLNSQKRTDITFRKTIIWVVTWLPLGIIFIPKYDVIGYLVTRFISLHLGIFYLIIWTYKNMEITVKIEDSTKFFISKARLHPVQNFAPGSFLILHLGQVIVVNFSLSCSSPTIPCKDNIALSISLPLK